MIDFCKSCIDPTRPITGEEASSEGYATPRSLETPVQKCPSLHQIRDPYASRHPASLRLTEEEKRQRLAKFTPKANMTPEDPTSPNNESIYTILIKLPETTSSNSGKASTSQNSNLTDQKSKSKSRTSIQQLLSEPDPALIKTMKRCDSEHLRSNNVPRGQGHANRNGAGGTARNPVSRTVPTTPGKTKIPTGTHTLFSHSTLLYWKNVWKMDSRIRYQMSNFSIPFLL